MVNAPMGGEVLDSRTTREILDQRAARLVTAAAKSGNPLDHAEVQEAVRARRSGHRGGLAEADHRRRHPGGAGGLLADQGGRIAAVSAEAGVFDSLGGRYTKTANIEALLMAWGGDEILVDRRGRPPNASRNRP